jgi:tRNA (adenine57-N1/adenine58-N1)-methyltransferase
MKKIKRVLVCEDGRLLYVRDASRDYHCQFGVVRREQLELPDGSEITTNTGVKMRIIRPSFSEQLRGIVRAPQAPLFKDMAAIVAETGIGRESFVIDAGAGSGMQACFLARHAGRVISYEIREDFFKVASENARMLGLDNLEIKRGNIYERIEEKNADVITLDVPEPWLALESVESSLKPGGFLVVYNPTIVQIMNVASEIKKRGSFVHIKTIEIIEREWNVEGLRVRPKSQQVGHSGFLSFYRKI